MSKQTVEVDLDLQDLIPQFLQNRKNDLATLRDLIDKGNMESLAQLAHKIKGAAAGYGFVELSQFASQIEVAAKKNDLAPLSNLVTSMQKHFDNIEVKFVSM